MHRVAVDRTSAVAVVEAAGEVDAFAAGDLQSAFAEVLAEAKVVIDLGGVTFLDSTALGLAVRAMREIDGAGGAAALVLPRGTARRIFEITTLDKVLPVTESRAEAIARLEPTA